MNKYKVQVIEDEINICNFMKMIFETHEYQAIFSQRGESGLTMFWSHHPDVVILDLGLPDMDGTEVIKQIRKASDTPIIVLSARSNEADKVENLIASIDALKEKIGIKPTIRDYVPDEKDFLERLDDMTEQAFDDQCTGANPRYPLLREIKQMYLNAYYGTHENI